MLTCTLLILLPLALPILVIVGFILYKFVFKGKIPGLDQIKGIFGKIPCVGPLGGVFKSMSCTNPGELPKNIPCVSSMGPGGLGSILGQFGKFIKPEEQGNP